MAQEQVQKQAPAKQEEIEEDTLEVKDQSELSEEVDDILADIDDVLEVNAEEFVNNYVQKGGE